jgi:hypothetical protein
MTFSTPLPPLDGAAAAGAAGVALDAVAAGPGAAGVAPLMAAPHLPQNFIPASTLAPQDVQKGMAHLPGEDSRGAV